MEIVVKKEELELATDFLLEAFDNLDGIEDKILKMEEHFDTEHVNEVFRPLHTLKGLSGFIEGLHPVTELCQMIEGILDDLRKEKIKKGAEVVDVLLFATDELKKILNKINEKRVGTSEGFSIDIDDEIFNGIKFKISGIKSDSSGKMPIKNNYLNGEIDKNFFDNLVKIQALFEKCLLRLEKGFLKKFVFERVETLIGLLIKNASSIKYEGCKICGEDLRWAVKKENADFIQVLRAFIDRCRGNISMCIEKGRMICFENNFQNTGGITKNSETVHDEKLQYIKIRSEKIDTIIGLSGELIALKNAFNQIYKELNDEYKLSKTAKKVKNLCNQVYRLSEEIQNEAMEARLVPVDSIFNKYHRVVRDLSKKLDKDVELIIEGKDAVIDKNLAEKINEPIIHLIRNAVDHGIENQQERIIKGKPVRGTVKIAASNKGRYINIDIFDDGKGLDREKILKKALEKKLINESDIKKMERDEDIYNLIFLPGFSTAASVTEISGRGVGMEIVRKTVDEAKGSIKITTQKNSFTCFSLQLPITMTMASGILFRTSGQKYLIPVEYIEEITKIESKKIYYYADKAYAEVRGKISTVVPVSLMLGETNKDIEDEICSNKDEFDTIFVLIIKLDGKYFAFVVEKFLGEQEFVLKSLPKNMKENPRLLGVTVDAEGNVIPVLNPVELIKRQFWKTVQK
ncbi:MAG: chemotaxis protein CheA [Tepidanaerobacteraceae bacterium]|jgi:two-component system chemotaxis sensor kinase CheA|nr:chemotaxis protein CheA [Tepidanaerobacteraceae bacterium]